MIYLDYAATSWPKPPQVLQAMIEFLQEAGGNAGRAGHRLSTAAGRIVYETREALATLFGVADPLRIVFTHNATHALNLALRGLLHPGDGVVTTGMEHNAVMRPLRALAREGVRLTIVAGQDDGTLDLAALQRALNMRPRMVVVSHANNVTGTILPVAAIAQLTHAAGALLLVDAAQTAGVLDCDVPVLGADLFAFTGHKGLCGPPGTGGLVLGERVDADAIQPLVCGGTGSRSESEEQPDDLPDKFEAGTPNGVGIAGLGAGVRFVLERGVATIRAHEVALTTRLFDGLRAIPGVRLYGSLIPAARTAVVSLTVEGRAVSDLGQRLDTEHGVLCRVGLHCAPATHRTIGTFPAGTVRMAPGLFTTLDEVDRATEGVAKVCG